MNKRSLGSSYRVAEIPESVASESTKPDTARTPAEVMRDAAAAIRDILTEVPGMMLAIENMVSNPCPPS